MTQPMREYVVLLPGDEAVWAAATEDQRQATYAKHHEFAKLLEERGHRVSGGAELAPSTAARVLRTDADGNQTITEGPYSEAVEQLTGFYVIETSNPEDLLEVCKLLGEREGVIEVRECKGGS